MLNTPVDANCEPMDFYLLSAERNTVVISADGATFEYFEVGLTSSNLKTRKGSNADQDLHGVARGDLKEVVVTDPNKDLFPLMVAALPAVRTGRPSTSATGRGARRICSKRRWTHRTAASCDGASASLRAKNIGLTITLADITEEEFRVLELIETERQGRTGCPNPSG